MRGRGVKFSLVLPRAGTVLSKSTAIRAVHMHALLSLYFYFLSMKIQSTFKIDNRILLRNVLDDKKSRK